MRLEQDSMVGTVLHEYLKNMPKSGNPLDIIHLQQVSYMH